MLSAALAHRSYRLYVPAEDRPVAANRRLIPWKFFLILALFELVASYSSAHIRSAYPLLVGSHSTVTTLVGGLVLFAWVWWFSNRLPLSALYRAPVILLCCGLLIVPLFGLGGNLAGSFCTALGVMLFNAIVFLFLYDISKRFGVSALLLFGIEESLLLVGWVGREGALLFDGSGLFGGTGPAIGAIVAIAAIVTVAALVLNEREIGERWGIAFMGNRPPEENERTRLARRCAAVAEERRLTPARAGGDGAARPGQVAFRRGPRAHHRRGHCEGPHAAHLREARHQHPPGTARLADDGAVAREPLKTPPATISRQRDKSLGIFEKSGQCRTQAICAKKEAQRERDVPSLKGDRRR